VTKTSKKPPQATTLVTTAPERTRHLLAIMPFDGAITFADILNGISRSWAMRDGRRPSVKLLMKWLGDALHELHDTGQIKEGYAPGETRMLYMRCSPAEIEQIKATPAEQRSDHLLSLIDDSEPTFADLMVAVEPCWVMVGGKRVGRALLEKWMLAALHDLFKRDLIEGGYAPGERAKRCRRRSGYDIALMATAAAKTVNDARDRRIKRLQDKVNRQIAGMPNVVSLR